MGKIKIFKCRNCKESIIVDSDVDMDPSECTICLGEVFLIKEKEKNEVSTEKTLKLPDAPIPSPPAIVVEKVATTIPDHTETVLTTKNTISLTIGIISVVIGSMTILFGWIPFLGVFVMPFAVIGIMIAFSGIIVAVIKKGGYGMPLLGGIFCLIGLLLPILFTGGLMKGIEEAKNKDNQLVNDNQKVIDIDNREEVENRKINERIDYINNNMRLYEVEARYMDSFLHGRVPGINFKVKNLGTKSLDEVEVTVYFKDSDGSIIAEEDFMPVLVTQYSLGDNKPLKPGYVWQNEKGKFYAAKSVPSEWKEGKISIKISDIKFTDTE